MALSKIPREVYEETLKAMRLRVHRALLSIGAQPPVVSLGFPVQWAIGEILRDAIDAYGYTPPKRRFQPSAKDLDDMLPVLGAIAKYKHEAIHGERDYKIILARAYDTPWHIIRDKLQTSAGERSLQRWQDRAVDEILNLYLTKMSEHLHKHMKSPNNSPQSKRIA